MARDVIDAVLGREGAERLPERDRRAAARRRGRSRRLDRIVAEIASVPAVAAAHPEAAARLVARHGTEAPGVVALGGELDLLRPLVPGRPFLEAEVAWAVRHELALSVDDVLSRRLRLSPELADRGAAVAPRVAAIMAGELGWDEARRDLRGRRLPRDRRPRVRDRAVAVGLESAPEPALGAPSDHGLTPSHDGHARQPRSRHAIDRRPRQRRRPHAVRVPDPGRDRVDRGWSSWSVVVACRLGWLAAARRHPGRDRPPWPPSRSPSRCRSAGTWARRSSSGPRSSRRAGRRRAAAAPAVSAAPSIASAPSVVPSGAPTAPPTPAATPFAATTVATGEFSGTDDFHFGDGTASIIEVEPGRYHLRLDDFSVRNGPDLFVYLSPDADGYADDALELGQAQGDRRIVRLRPARRRRPGPIPERPHLVQAVQPPVRRGAVRARDRMPRKSGLYKHVPSAYHPAGKRHGNVRGQNVARRSNSDSSHG